MAVQANDNASLYDRMWMDNGCAWLTIMPLSVTGCGWIMAVHANDNASLCDRMWMDNGCAC